MPCRRIIAHRGHIVGAPEQTMPAYEMAAKLGASMIEIDMRFTRDGVAVLMHDSTLDRTTSGTGLVSDIDWSYMKLLDAGSWFGSDFAGSRVPLLEEAFDFAERYAVGLCIEAKGDDGENTRAALHAAREVERRGRLRKDVIASFDHNALAAAIVEVPGLQTAPDRLPERGRSTASQLIEQAARTGAKIIQHHFADLEADVVAEVQAAGIEVWAWPPANLIEARIAYDSGAIGIIGDDVAAVAAVIGEDKN